MTLVLLLLACAVAPPDARIDDWVGQLGDGDYYRREAAQQALTEAGEAAVDALRAAAADADVERRLRARAVLQEIGRRRLWRATPVDVVEDGTPVLEVVRRIAEASGNPVHWDRVDQAIAGQVTADWRGVPYLQALDRLAAAHDFTIHHYNDPKVRGVVLRSGTPDRNPTDYFGPLRCELVSADRSVQRTLRYHDGQVEGQDSLELYFDVNWENAFPLARHGGLTKATVARTDSGESLVKKSRVPGTLMPLERRDRQLSLLCRLEPPERPAMSLAELVVEVPLVAAGDFGTLAVESLEPGTTSADDGRSLSVTALERNRDNGKVTLLWRRREPLDLHPRADLVEESLEVLDAAGEPVSFNQVSVRAAPEQCVYTLLVNLKQKPARVEMRYARLRSERTATFRFENVPLPQVR